MGEDIGTKINQNFGLNSNNFKLVKKKVRLELCIWVPL